MRILFIVEHFPSFSETFVLNQVTGLLDLGNDVTIYAVGKPSGSVTHPDVEKYNLLERTWSGANVPTSRKQRLLGALRNFPKLFKRCGFRAFLSINPLRHGKKAINLGFFYSCLPLVNRETTFDAIHCHFGDKGLLALAWREMGLVSGPLSTVFHAHELAGLSDREGRNLYGPLFRSNTLLLPISERWRQRLIHWGANPEQTLVHHMGIDIGAYCYSPHFPELNEPVNILTVARLVEQKGYEYAIRAVAKLSNMTTRKLHYTIIGSGDGAGNLEYPLRQLVTKLGIGSLVTFAGPQPQDIVQHYMQRSNMFLLPSVTTSNGFQEGIPVALMEAMASGLPVITTRHSGIPELVQHEISGFLAEERDVDLLVEALSRLIADNNLFVRISVEGRKKVENEFDVDKLNLKLNEIFYSRT
jgi:colanic acid/amylovoran biosynthesis glycosyltransferase